MNCSTHIQIYYNLFCRCIMPYVMFCLNFCAFWKLKNFYTIKTGYITKKTMSVLNDFWLLLLGSQNVPHFIFIGNWYFF